MRTTTKKLLGAGAAAVLIAAGGSAFTASNSIDNARAQVGTVEQSVAGINITDVAYTGLDETWETSTGVTFKVAEQFDDGVKPSISVNGAAALAPEAVTLAWVPAAGEEPAHTLVTVDFGGAINVTSLRVTVDDQ